MLILHWFTFTKPPSRGNTYVAWLSSYIPRYCLCFKGVGFPIQITPKHACIRVGVFRECPLKTLQTAHKPRNHHLVQGWPQTASSPRLVKTGSLTTHNPPHTLHPPFPLNYTTLHYIHHTKRTEKRKCYPSCSRAAPSIFTSSNPSSSLRVHRVFIPSPGPGVQGPRPRLRIRPGSVSASSSKVQVRGPGSKVQGPGSRGSMFTPVLAPPGPSPRLHTESKSKSQSQSKSKSQADTIPRASRSLRLLRPPSPPARRLRRTSHPPAPPTSAPPRHPLPLPRPSPDLSHTGSGRPTVQRTGSSHR